LEMIMVCRVVQYVPSFVPVDASGRADRSPPPAHAATSKSVPARRLAGYVASRAEAPLDH
jgi:hypothetical protein